MKPIVLQLQEDAVHHQDKTSDLLRKALVVASKLGVKEFETWIRNELNGYNVGLKDVPEYRKIYGRIVAFNPYHGWIEVLIRNEQMANTFRINSLQDSVSAVESLVAGPSDNLHLTLSPSMEAKFNEWADGPATHFAFEFPKAQAEAMLESVRNIILEWSLKLEKDGILGDGLSFSDIEKEVAVAQGYTVNHFHGEVHNSQFQQNGPHSVQVMTNESLDLKKLRELLVMIKDHAEELPDEIKEDVEKIELELTQSSPDNSVITTSLAAIKSVLSNVTGNLIASGVLYFIGQLLA